MHRHILVLALGLGPAGAACSGEPETSVDAPARDMGGDVEGRDLGQGDHPVDSGEGGTDGGWSRTGRMASRTGMGTAMGARWDRR